MKTTIENPAQRRVFVTRLVWCLIGSFVLSCGINLFIVPLGLYSGGFMGISQIARTLLMEVLQTDFGGRDIAGVLYLILNIPVLVLAWFHLSKRFFVKTITCVASNSLFLSLIPIPAEPIMPEMLAGCMIGGIICGLGGGLMFKNGGSGGGTDIIGMILTKKYRNLSVGRISMAVNFTIYGVCIFLFTPAVAIYSIIYATFSSFIVDKVYTQTINVQAMIVTSSDGEAIRKVIVEQFHRGVTLLDGVGGYTGTARKVLYTVVSKYEAGILGRMIMEVDPHAFVVFNEGSHVEGNFQRRLE